MRISFSEWLRLALSIRRKTLWNNLTNHFGKSEEVKAKLEQALEIADIKPSIRGEALSISDFAHLSDALREAGL